MIKRLKHLKLKRVHLRLKRKKMTLQKVRLLKTLKHARLEKKPTRLIIRKLKHLKLKIIHNKLTTMKRKRKQIRIVKRLKLIQRKTPAKLVEVVKRPKIKMIKRLKHLKLKRIHLRLKRKKMKLQKVRLLNTLKRARLEKKPTMLIIRKLKHLKLKIIHNKLTTMKRKQKQIRIVKRLKLIKNKKPAITTVKHGKNVLGIKIPHQRMKQLRMVNKSLLKEIEHLKEQLREERLEKTTSTTTETKQKENRRAIIRKKKLKMQLKKIHLNKKLKRALLMKKPTALIIRKLKELRNIVIRKKLMQKPRTLKMIRLLKKLKMAKKKKLPIMRIVQKIKHMTIQNVSNKATYRDKLIKELLKKIERLIRQNEQLHLAEKRTTTVKKVRRIKSSKELRQEKNRQQKEEHLRELKITQLCKKPSETLKQLVEKKLILEKKTTEIRNMTEKLERIMRENKLLKRKLRLEQVRIKHVRIIKKIRQKRLKHRKLKKMILVTKPKTKVRRIVQRLKQLPRKKTIRKLTLTQRKLLTNKLIKELRIANKEKKSTTEILKRLKWLSMSRSHIEKRKELRLIKQRNLRMKRLMMLKTENEKEEKEPEEKKTEEEREERRKTEREAVKRVAETPEELKRTVIKEGKELHKKQKHNEGVELKKSYRREETVGVGRNQLFMTKYRTRKEVVVYETSYSCPHGYKLRFRGKDSYICYKIIHMCDNGYKLSPELDGQPLCHKKIPRCATGYTLQRLPGMTMMCFRRYPRCPHGFKLKKLSRKRGICIRTVKVCQKGYSKRIRGKATLCIKKIQKCKKRHQLVKHNGGPRCKGKVPTCKEGYKLQKAKTKKPECIKNIPTCSGDFVMKTKKGKKPVCTKKVKVHACDKGFRLREKGGKKECVKVEYRCLPGFSLVDKPGKKVFCQKTKKEVPEKSRHEEPPKPKTETGKKKVMQTITTPPIAKDLPLVQKCSLVEKDITKPVENVIKRAKSTERFEYIRTYVAEKTMKPKEVRQRRRPRQVEEEIEPIFEERTEKPTNKEITMGADIVRRPVHGKEMIVTSRRTPVEVVKSMKRFRQVPPCSEGYSVIRHGGRKECVRCPHGYKPRQENGYLACYKTIIKCLEGYKPKRKHGENVCVNKVFGCPDGFESKKESGRTICLKKAPSKCTGTKRDLDVSGCSKTIHSCPVGYQLSKEGSLDVCVKKAEKCTKGYLMKKKGKKTICVKQTPTCDNGYHLSGTATKPTCEKKIPKCTNGYKMKGGVRPMCTKQVYSCPNGCTLFERHGRHMCRQKATETAKESTEVPASAVEVTIQTEDTTVYASPRMIEVDTEPSKHSVDRVPAAIRTILIKDEKRTPHVVEVTVTPQTKTSEKPIEIKPLRLNAPTPKLQYKWLAPKLFTTLYPYLNTVTKAGRTVPLHVVLVVDNSGDIRQNEFDYIRRFLRTLVDNPRLDWKLARIGVITTGNNANVIFGLSRPRRVKKLLGRMKRVGGVGNLGGAMRLASRIFKKDPVGHARKVAIVMNANSPACRKTPAQPWDDLYKQGVATVTITAGKGPSPPFYNHLKEGRHSDALLLPSFNILPSYQWMLRRARHHGLRSPKNKTTLRSFVTAITCRPGYKLRYEKGKGPNCFKTIRKFVKCPKGFTLTRGKSPKCIKKEHTCPDEYELTVIAKKSACAKKVYSCPEKYRLVPLSNGDKVCLEQVHKCEEGYKIRITGDKKTECYRTILTCTPGFNLEERPGKNPVCTKRLTEHKCEQGYKLKSQKGGSVCVKIKQHGKDEGMAPKDEHDSCDRDNETALTDLQGFRELHPCVRDTIVVEKIITRPADEKEFSRGLKEAVSIIKPSENADVKVAKEETRTKQPVEVNAANVPGGKHGVPRLIELKVGVAVLRRPILKRSEVRPDGRPPVDVVLLGKRIQVRPKSGKILQCAKGFELDSSGKEPKCIRQCTKQFCFKTVHKCRSGYIFESGKCKKSALKCTNGYQLKVKDGKHACIKAIPACTDGYSLDKRGGKPTCFKAVPYCTKEYKLRERKSERQCVRRLYSCDEGSKLTTKDGKKVCLKKETVLTCDTGYKLIGKSGEKPYCHKTLTKGGKQHGPFVKQPMLYSLERYEKGSFVEVTIQPETRTVESSIRLINVETVPIKVTLDSVPARMEKVPSEFETNQPMVVKVDMKQIHETVQANEANTSISKAADAFRSLFGTNSGRKILDMTEREFLKQFGKAEPKKVHIESEQKPYRWVPLELHRPRSAGTKHEAMAEHRGPWYMFSSPADHHEKGSKTLNDADD